MHLCREKASEREGWERGWDGGGGGGRETSLQVSAVSQVWGNRAVTMRVWSRKAVRKNFMDMCYIFVF